MMLDVDVGDEAGRMVLVDDVGVRATVAGRLADDPLDC